MMFSSSLLFAGLAAASQIAPTGIIKRDMQKCLAAVASATVDLSTLPTAFQNKPELASSLASFISSASVSDCTVPTPTATGEFRDNYIALMSWVSSNFEAAKTLQAVCTDVPAADTLANMGLEDLLGDCKQIHLPKTASNATSNANNNGNNNGNKGDGSGDGKGNGDGNGDGGNGGSGAAHTTQMLTFSMVVAAVAAMIAL